MKRPKKAELLEDIADEIRASRSCKKGGTGLPVPGEGNSDARVLFVGEAPGKEEAKVGRPFIGRSGKFLRQAIADIGLSEDEFFITSPGHYLPLRGKPSKEMVLHGREHLFRQMAVIAPEIVVLLGSTACLAVLDQQVEVAKQHGTVLPYSGGACLITLHPAYALRFPAAREQFLADLQVLGKLLRKRSRRT